MGIILINKWSRCLWFLTNFDIFFFTLIFSLKNLNKLPFFTEHHKFPSQKTKWCFISYSTTAFSQFVIIMLLILSPEEASHTQNLSVMHIHLEVSKLKCPHKHASMLSKTIILKKLSERNYNMVCKTESNL